MPEPAVEKTSSDKSVRDQRDRFLAFSFASADLFVEVSEEGRITHAIGAAKGITGIDEKTLVGKKWLELFSVYEQATMIHAYERAKPGMRCGPLLINLSETMGGRKAIMTAIKMPGSNKFYVTFGVASAVMARIAHVMAEQQGFDLLSKFAFIEALQNALARTRTTGQEITIALFDFAPTRMDRSRMGEGAWSKLRTAIGELLIAESFDGYTAGEIVDGRMMLVHDKKITHDILREKLAAAAKQSDPGGQGVNIRSKSISVDPKTMKERESARAIEYAINEFQDKGSNIQITSLNTSFESFISSNAARVKELQTVIEQSKFSMHYQPIVDLKTAEAAHFEMLLRFDSGATKEWVKFAEDAGLSHALDMAVCDRAINHVKFKAGTTWTKFSVNITSRSAENSAFTAELLEKLGKQKNVAERLMFEITDSLQIREHDKVNRFIMELQTQGYKVALDDFGPETGAQDILKKITPDFYKLDGKYARRILTSQREAEPLKNLVQNCRERSAEVIAKWIEEKPQADLYAAMGVTYGQGYLFGKPGPKPDYNAQKE